MSLLLASGFKSCSVRFDELLTWVFCAYSCHDPMRVEFRYGCDLGPRVTGATGSNACVDHHIPVCQRPVIQGCVRLCGFLAYDAQRLTHSFSRLLQDCSRVAEDCGSAGNCGHAFIAVRQTRKPAIPCELVCAALLFPYLGNQSGTHSDIP